MGSWVLGVLLAAFSFLGNGLAQDTVFPAVVIFGDSGVDAGNNNYLLSTLFKANYPPYGMDFADHEPTGRCCNGKLATDIVVETLGFTTYPAAYLSPEATGKRLLIGANFASTASGYDEKTAVLNHVIPLSQQLQYFEEYKEKLAKIAGHNKSEAIVNGAFYLLSAGTADFLVNYYVNPRLNKAYTPDQYGNYLLKSFTRFIEKLYKSGATRIGVTSLPPLGCFPVARTLFAYHRSGCVSKVNSDAQKFNKKLTSAATRLKKKLPGLRIVVFDIFNPLYDLVKAPSSFGFAEATKGCCRTERVGRTAMFCDAKSPWTCSNATQFVFWDDVHPSEAANQVLADALIVQGYSLI